LCCAFWSPFQSENQTLARKLTAEAFKATSHPAARVTEEMSRVKKSFA
jgi:hypothetical protein